MRKKLLLVILIPVSILTFLLGWCLFYIGSSLQDKLPKKQTSKMVIETTVPLWEEVQNVSN